MNVEENKNETNNNLEEESVVNSQETINKDKKDKKNKKWKYFLYFSIVLIVTAAVLAYNLLQPVQDDSAQLVYEMIPYFVQTMRYDYLALFLGCFLCFFLLNALSMYLYAKLYYRHYKFHQAMAVQAIDNFYSSITPGAYGGEFAKAYVFNKQGVAVSNAASILVMNFIVYQITLCLVGLISIVTRFNAILSIPAFDLDIVINGAAIPPIPFWVFIIIGYFLNILVTILLLFMSLSRRLHNFVINKLITFLGKIKLIRKPEEKKQSVRLQVENYRIELQRLFSNIPFAILMFFITFLIICLNGLNPFLSGLTLGGFENPTEDINWFLKIYDSIAFSNFHQMVTGLIPIPGTAGIAEYVFERLYGSGGGYFTDYFYSLGGANMVLIFWRMITFYIPFLINGIVAATYKSRGLPLGERILDIPNKKTVVTLSFETIDERKESFIEQQEILQENKQKKLEEKELKKEKKEIKKKNK